MTVPGDTGAGGPGGRKPSRRDRRRQRMAAEIRHSRSGEHRVPTWAMAVILVAILGTWIALIFIYG